MNLIGVRAVAIIAPEFLFLTPMIGVAQQESAATSLQQLLEAQFPPARTTPDGLDLASQGTVVVLQKDNLKTITAALNNAVQVNGQGLPFAPTPNAYVNGSISESGVIGWLNRKIEKLPGAADPNTHIFNAGGKLWVTRIQSRTEGVTFSLMSDPIAGVRYYGTLKFSYGKGASPAPEQVLSLISEVLRNDSQSAQVASSQTAAELEPTQTKTVSPGQSKSQIEAMLGPPTRTFKIGTKETYFYPDMKVTFVNSKVTDIQ